MLRPDKSQLVRRKFREYIASKRFERDFQAMHPSRSMLWFAVLLTALRFKLRLGLNSYRGARRVGFGSARLRHEYAELAEIGVPAVAYAAMHSGTLRQGRKLGPAMLVVSFGASATEDETKHHAVIAGSVDDMAETPDETQLARLLADQSHRFRRRRAFPTGLTKGSEVYAFDALISPGHLPKSQLQTPRIVCIVDTRPGGIIFALPVDIVEACGLDSA